MDIESLETNKVLTTTLADGIAIEMANFLQQTGYKAVPQIANLFTGGVQKIGCWRCVLRFPTGIWQYALG